MSDSVGYCESDPTGGRPDVSDSVSDQRHVVECVEGRPGGHEPGSLLLALDPVDGAVARQSGGDHPRPGRLRAAGARGAPRLGGAGRWRLGLRHPARPLAGAGAGRGPVAAPLPRRLSAGRPRPPRPYPAPAPGVPPPPLLLPPGAGPPPTPPRRSVPPRGGRRRTRGPPRAPPPPRPPR